MTSVKPRRIYDSSGRREQAARNREAILETARAMFLSAGYGPTTVSAIAAAANVSPETIYKGFGGKTGLVRALWQQSLQGSGPIPAETRSDEVRVQEPDPRRIIETWGQFVTEVAPLGAPIVFLIRSAAASDPAMARLLETVDQARLERMETNARSLYDRGAIRPDVSLAEARDVLWLYSSPELYELLVIRRGWPIERYGRFVAREMIAALLPPADPKS